jgi:hypothetical protein
MVKLKDTHVSLTAINAGMGRQVGVKSSLVFLNNTVITRLGSVEIDLLVILIVGLIRFCLTVPTSCLAYTAIFVSPTKIFLGITLFAAARTNLFHGVRLLSEKDTQARCPGI